MVNQLGLAGRGQRPERHGRHSSRRDAKALKWQMTIVLAQEAQKPFVVLGRHVEQLDQQPVVAVAAFEPRLHDLSQIVSRQSRDMNTGYTVVQNDSPRSKIR